MSTTHGQQHSETPAGGNVATAQPTVVPLDFEMPVQKDPDKNGNGHDAGGTEEYLVDVEIHTSLVVHATSLETAVAKAILYTSDGEDDSVTEVGRDVHTCIHTGLDSDDECDHEEHEERD